MALLIPAMVSAESEDPLSQNSAAGLLHTYAELAIWNQRRIDGPYKEHWDEKIFTRATQFLNGQEDHLNWKGRISPGCWRTGSEIVYTPGRQQSAYVRDATFVYRVFKHANDPAHAQSFAPV